MAKGYLSVMVNCITKDVQGFENKNKGKEIKIPLRLKPPKDKEELKYFAEEFWTQEELKKHGSGPNGEFPEININKILRKEII